MTCPSCGEELVADHTCPENRKKAASLWVTWEDYSTEPTCIVGFRGAASEEEKNRLLVSLGHALIERYGLR